MNYTIRKIRLDELESALDLVSRVFNRFEAPHYTEQGIQSFYDFANYSHLSETMQDGSMSAWGAFREDQLLGMISIRNQNHISLLFVDAAHHRQGIGRRLFEAAAAYILQSGYREITVFSSPYAVPVYRKLGFKALNSEQTVNGIRYTPMKWRVGARGRC